MKRAGKSVARRSGTGRNTALEKTLLKLFGLTVAAAVALPVTSAVAQDGSSSALSPVMPKFIMGEKKRQLTPEEEEQERKIDADYKAANSKIPAQKAPDPWGDVRQAPAGATQKTSSSTPNASKKKVTTPQPQ